MARIAHDSPQQLISLLLLAQAKCSCFDYCYCCIIVIVVTMFCGYQGFFEFHRVSGGIFLSMHSWCTVSSRYVLVVLGNQRKNRNFGYANNAAKVLFVVADLCISWRRFCPCCCKS